VGYLIAAYLIVGLVLGGYALHLERRRRRLKKAAQRS
jgi:CcmD family protein